MKLLHTKNFSIAAKLDKDGDLEIEGMLDDDSSESYFINKDEAIDLMLHLNAVFNLNIV